MTSRRTLERFAAGDPAAVQTLYDEYGRVVMAVAYKALGDRWLAEEAVQQTFLQAWRGAATFDPGRDPGPWLATIARRAAIDIYRRERRHRSASLDEGIEIASLPPSFEQLWEVWRLRTALDRLPENDRRILHALHALDLTHEEAASHLGIPVGTVKSASHRAYRRLARMLADLRQEESA